MRDLRRLRGGVLFALVAFGRASDQVGRRRVLLAGLACAGLSAVAFLVANGLGLLLVGRVLSGLSVGIFVGAATAALADLAGPLGHGLCFRDGLQAINARAPVQRRGGVASTYFIVLYIGISVPVLGEGIAAAGLGLQTAGIAFSIVVAVIVALALATLVTVQSRERRGIRDGSCAPGCTA